MGRGRKKLGGVLDLIERGPLRSSLFYWLVDHHDEIVQAAAGKRISWDALIYRFEALGLTDRSGKPASAKTAEQTWRRAKAWVAQYRKDTAEKQAALLPTLRPIALPPACPPIQANSPSYSRQPVVSQPDELPGGSLAALQSEIEKRSGR